MRLHIAVLVALLVVILSAGCQERGGAPTSRPAEQAPPPRPDGSAAAPEPNPPAAFDPDSMYGTWTWFLDNGRALRALRDNDLAYKKHLELMGFDKLVGKSVSWAPQGASIRQAGDEYAEVSLMAHSSPIDPDELLDALRDAEITGRYSGKKFPFYRLQIGEKRQNGNMELSFLVPKAAWLEKIKKQDRISVKGKVAHINLDRSWEAPIYDFYLYLEAATLEALDK